MNQLSRMMTRTGGSPKTKVLLVRQPARSVRPGEEPSRTGVHLAIGVIVAVGTLAALWLVGELGYRLGFARLMCVPELLGQPGGGLVTGTLIIIGIPAVIFRAALEQPALLLAGFALIAIPAGALGAIRQYTPGGPRVPSIVRVSAYVGMAGALVTAGLLIWWTTCSYRMGLVGQVPFEAALGQSWLLELRIAAGLDVLAVAASAVWMVLAFRLPVPIWARAIGSTVSIFALVFVTVAMSITNATVAQVTADRSVCGSPAGTPGAKLLLGSTRDQRAMLWVDDGRVTIELRDKPQSLLVFGRQSIHDAMREGAAEQQ